MFFDEGYFDPDRVYAMGADGTTDNDSAARWFQRAAELGVSDSQFNLGILAAKGVGMPQNLEESSPTCLELSAAPRPDGVAG